jgi:serine protease Do
MASTSPARRRTFLGAVALSALIAGGAAGAGFMAPAPQALAQAQPITVPAVAMPSFADVVERVKPAVVSVRVKAQAVADRGDGPDATPPGIPEELERFFRGPDGQRRFGPEGRRFGEENRRADPRPAPRRAAQGSGFFISADGFVVTNNHVVQNASEVQILTDDGRSVDARVVGTDPKTDLALLKVKEQGTFPFVKFAEKSPRVGDWVVAIGNPFGLGGTVTAGIVSARGRDIGSGPYDDYIQIDAPVNRGNSGGPTFNLNGEVVGVNTAIFSPSGGNVGIAFAIPSEVTGKIVAQLKDGGTVARGFIGVQIQPVTKEIADAIGLKEARGALVAETVRGGPAEKAGLKSGDTILALDGQALKDARELSRRVADIAPGKSVALTVWREGQERQVQLEIGRQDRT